MSWNYRVIRTIDDEGSGDVCYEICECHYDKKGDAIPTSWSDPVTVMSKTRTGLFWVLAVMTEGIAQPILEVQGGKLVEVEPVRELTDDLNAPYRKIEMKALSRLVDDVIREVSELPDRTSPEDEPDMMLVTAEELRKIIVANLGEFLSRP